MKPVSDFEKVPSAGVGSELYGYSHIAIAILGGK